MRGEVIALDLETTGLDHTIDRIIEVGIARCKDDEILDTYQTLINPHDMHIPSRVIQLTGITSEDVKDSPYIEKVLPDIRDFIGDRPIIGQNIMFDINFLRIHGIANTNTPVDTYDLASAFMPTAHRYSLSSLMQALELELENAHRALDDAIASWKVYRKLWHMLLTRPLNLLTEILDMSVSLDWLAKPALLEAVRLRTENGELPGGPLNISHAFPPPARDWLRLRPNETITPIDMAAVSGILEPGGEISQKVPGYESRDSQIIMLRTIVRAFNQNEHFVIEAPTGTGKSLAYLLPAVRFAMENNQRVVVSTHTINLQEQLLLKEIPLLKETLGLNFVATELKGRSNYICPRRLHIMRQKKPSSMDELRVMAKVLVWLQDGGNGQLSELNVRGPLERAAWYRLSAADEGCTTTTCENKMKGICPLFKAKRKAEAAHILIVNHALLLSDVAMGNRVLPDYEYLILDEGHHLEGAVTDSLMTTVDKYTLLRWVNDLGNTKKGLLGMILKETQSLPGRYSGKIIPYIEGIAVAIKQMNHHVRQFFDLLPEVLLDENTVEDFMSQIRITDLERQQDYWNEVLLRWSTLGEFTRTLSDSMRKLAAGLGNLDEVLQSQVNDFDTLLSSLHAASDNFTMVHRTLRNFVEEPAPNTIYWVSIGRDLYPQITVNAAPLHVGDLVEQHLWSQKKSIILTSATLRTGAGFDYLIDRLNGDSAQQLALSSPFDYKNSTLLYLPTDIPEPTSRKAYQEAIEKCIIEVASVTGGRMLCLFTSHRQLSETASAVAPRLALGDIEVLDQSSGAGRQALLETFQTAERAVLLGTSSFWEGVDVPGEALSVVIITRLPFSVPSDPIFAARSETYGERSFLDFSVPDAILRFRQGFGRLIRRKDDRGVVIILDKRIISRRYGKHFLDSLPGATVQRGVLGKLPLYAKNWLDKDNHSESVGAGS